MNEQQQIDPRVLENATDVVCENCKGIFFDQTVALKKVSAVDPNNPTGQAQVVPMGLFVCRNCDTPIQNLE